MRYPMLYILFVLFSVAFAYVPASPTNSTRDAIAAGLNVTDISKLHLQWYSNGSYSEHVSYQLVGNGSTGISRGVLVHFSENDVNKLTPPTLTPWIALVSCDYNATDHSMEEDIFTLARDKGAVSALLYSLYSAACIINPEYTDPATFDQVFDIFSTQSLTSAHLIEYQFGQLGPANKSLANYNSLQLNQSAQGILQSITDGSPVSAGYLLGVLQAYNATDVSNTSNTGSNPGNADVATSNSPNTALAMIILYAITGCVSALFCVVIVSGAIRAIRHPERYGPRARMGGVPQSRARGLTRAILDTFPIVKFGTPQTAPTPPVDKDLEQQPNSTLNVELKENQNSHILTSTASGSASANDIQEESQSIRMMSDQSTSLSAKSPQKDISDRINKSSGDVGEGSSTSVPTRERPMRDEVVPAAIGRETCPICIVDFEEGDDIRLLPCEGKHCFHQQCVDPWLLKLSSSCPICRHDFLALENMLSGHADEEFDEAEYHPAANLRASHAGRFSRYLRFARRRHHRGDEPDPTDPYMPTAPETSASSTSERHQ